MPLRQSPWVKEPFFPIFFANIAIAKPPFDHSPDKDNSPAIKYYQFPHN